MTPKAFTERKFFRAEVEQVYSVQREACKATK